MVAALMTTPRGSGFTWNITGTNGAEVKGCWLSTPTHPLRGSPSPQGGGSDDCQRVLAIVDFAADEFQAAAGDAVGLAVLAGYGLLVPQLFEEEQGEGGDAPAVAVVEFDRDDAALGVLDRSDVAALGEGVQHPLFVAGNVHWNSLGCAENIEAPPAYRLAAAMVLKTPSPSGTGCYTISGRLDIG